MFYLKNILYIFSKRVFYGWGRKRTGNFANLLAKKFNGKCILLEDGFIRSVGLGVNGAESFSLVEDDVGIYYDATTSSRLEQILSSYDFGNDLQLLKEAEKCIDYIYQYNITKYNDAPDITESIIRKYALKGQEENILIITQTSGDASLTYGLGDQFSTKEMIEIALKENSNANILLKIHPDVLSGKKKLDIDLKNLNPKIRIITENINSIALLKWMQKVYTKTSGMGFEALLCGCKCVCFGVPFYAGWGISEDRVAIPARRKRKLSVIEVFAGAYLLYTRYINPYTKKQTTLLGLLPQIYTLKMAYLQKDKKAIFLFGFSIWKRGFMRPFLNGSKAIFISTFSKNPLKIALKKGINKNALVYIWGRKEFEEVQIWCEKNAVEIIRVEDGFIRSVGLGSDLTRPYSLVFDGVGMYFDTTKPSQLENILNYHSFSAFELQMAEELKGLLISSKISKYNDDKYAKIAIEDQKRIALVIGQVEDDASVRIGADEMTNLQLLKQARKNSPNTYMIYKPHPDVVSGNRVGVVLENEALKYCDRILCDVSMAVLLDMADEIHTMTSTSGLEAILRGKDVICYGRAFWAGWGLSKDMQQINRRFRALSVLELIAGAYIIYPKYIHPNNLQFCNAKDLVYALKQQKAELENPLNALLHKAHSVYARIGQKILFLFAYLVRK